ncbi:FKBP-type peptidyl-prolyl cis-trans isomerase [Winogradskyella alexanderae]|uniref:peptidylprolyl isomerase n=1 Tax=Winogradskyella alexanderae TaxID=2877123 RepID=A0ABS7XQS6_9FLAO|nr:hypothetical protein [Winogradskyella alexanderae]MCA0132365.1 hypothetical protein [Winogradskyella alexanderae]
MKIKTLKLAFLLLCVLGVVVACEEDDSPIQTEFIEEDRTEQQAKDRDSLLAYLNTHYYNSEFFEAGTNHTIDDIVITELGEGEDVPDGHTLLIQNITTRNITYLDVEYEYYFLKLNQGGGDAPKFSDKVRVRYEGYFVDGGDTFDQVSTPIDLDLYGIAFGTGAITAWQRILPEFNSSVGFSISEDNIVSYDDYGLGVMFVPSGLGYFSFPRQGIPQYSNLIFKFELLQTEVNDHDGDGIPSFIEDYDNNLDPFDDNTDGDSAPDYIDLDDDNDGVITRNELVPTTYVVDTNMGELEPVLGANEFELSRVEENGVITIETVTMVDTNDNNVFDHLDEEVTTNYNEEEEG